MGKDKRHVKKEYEPLDSGSLQNELNPGQILPPTPVVPAAPKSNPFRVIGAARISKTGLSLSIRIIDDRHTGPISYRYLTVLKSDIIKLFTDGNNLSVCDVREFDNSNTKKDN
jgi:hypothetical protein